MARVALWAAGQHAEATSGRLDGTLKMPAGYTRSRYYGVSFQSLVAATLVLPGIWLVVQQARRRPRRVSLIRAVPELERVPEAQRERAWRSATLRAMRHWQPWLGTAAVFVAYLVVAPAVRALLGDGTLVVMLLGGGAGMATTLTMLKLMRPYAVRHLREQLGEVCPACGYDLRASPERCPECGTAVEPKVSVT